MATWTADDGTVINYEIYDNGNVQQTLLLLPGVLGSIGSQWQQFTRPLSQDFRLVLMDLRGHGRSTNTNDKLMPQQMVGDIIGLLDHLQIGIVNVAGYSLGGYLGMMLALKQSRRVNTLLMHATKFYWGEESLKAMQAQFDPDRMAEKVPTYADQLVLEHGSRRWRDLVREAAALITLIARDGLTDAHVKNCPCPVLVSVGDRDELVLLPEAHRLSRKIENAELLVLPGVRHPFQTIRPVPLLPMMQHFHARR